MVICCSIVRKLPSALVRSSVCWFHIICQLPTFSMLLQRCACQNHVIFSARPTAGSDIRSIHQIGGGPPPDAGGGGGGGGGGLGAPGRPPRSAPAVNPPAPPGA